MRTGRDSEEEAVIGVEHWHRLHYFLLFLTGIFFDSHLLVQLSGLNFVVPTTDGSHFNTKY